MQPTPPPQEVKAQLEIEKLRAELARIRGANRPWSVITNNTAVFTAILAAVSLGVGFIQFNRQQRDTAESEEATRAQELSKTYWLEQKRSYDQAAHAAATIASADSLKNVDTEVRQFWALYWGGMSLVESNEVELAMVEFGKQLTSWQETGNKPRDVKTFSYQVAHCMKQSLAKTWRPVAGAEVRDPKCPYPN